MVWWCGGDGLVVVVVTVRWLWWGWLGDVVVMVGGVVVR